MTENAEDMRQKVHLSQKNTKKRTYSYHQTVKIIKEHTDFIPEFLDVLTKRVTDHVDTIIQEGASEGLSEAKFGLRGLLTSRPCRIISIINAVSNVFDIDFKERCDIARTVIDKVYHYYDDKGFDITFKTDEMKDYKYELSEKELLSLDPRYDEDYICSNYGGYDGIAIFSSAKRMVISWK